MDERGVTPPMVEAVLRAGVPEPDISGLPLRTSLYGITVVVDERAGHVVTVFNRRNPPARFSPKRLARRQGQARRRYEHTRDTQQIDVDIFS